MKTKRKPITVQELGETFSTFQLIHPECPYMEMTFTAFGAENGIRPSIHFGLNRACYIASYSTGSFEELYDMMKKDINKRFADEDN